MSANAPVAAKLTALMQGYIDSGRSTPGAAQKNDVELSLPDGEGKPRRANRGNAGAVEREPQRERALAGEPSSD